MVPVKQKGDNKKIDPTATKPLTEQKFSIHVVIDICMHINDQAFAEKAVAELKTFMPSIN